MPDPVLAEQQLDVPPFGRLLRVDLYGLKPRHPRDLPYSAVARKFQEEGCHTNVFLVDDNNHPIWRIADYELYRLTDSFVSLRPSGEQGKAIGVTFQGHIFEITLADGSLKKIGWTK
jgi:hypothetical protein